MKKIHTRNIIIKIVLIVFTALVLSQTINKTSAENQYFHEINQEELRMINGQSNDSENHAAIVEHLTYVSNNPIPSVEKVGQDPLIDDPSDPTIPIPDQEREETNIEEHDDEPDDNKEENDEPSDSPGNQDKPSNPTPTPPQEKPAPSNSIGRFKVPSVGINVACYAGSAQSIVDRSDSAAYFYCDGHNVIADHSNQDFGALKRVTAGMSATFGSTKYKCVAKIYGHNTGYSLTDSNGNSIANKYPGTLVCYTCNGNWKNIIIVFFERESSSEPEYDCGNGKHYWGNWRLEWERYDNNGKYYGWDSRECKLCYEEEWRQRTEPTENCPKPEPQPTEPEPEPTEPEPTVPTEPTPTDPTPTEPTEPKPVEPKPTEPVVQPTEPASTEPQATEPNFEDVAA